MNMIEKVLRERPKPFRYPTFQFMQSLHLAMSYIELLKMIVSYLNWKQQLSQTAKKSRYRKASSAIFRSRFMLDLDW